MQSLLHGEHRRAVIMAAVGGAAIAALLVFRLFAGGEDDGFTAPADERPVAAPADERPVAAPADERPVAASPPSPPIDPALLRDPFCPLVAAPAAPVVCRRPVAPPEHQAVGLLDVFIEGGVRLARMHVGPLTFPNLHEGESFAGAFRVVSLSDRCGEFESARQRFFLCEGEESFE